MKMPDGELVHSFFCSQQRDVGAELAFECSRHGGLLDLIGIWTKQFIKQLVTTL
jgi:hypothetical protein